MWSNRAYGFVAWCLYFLWRRDGIRLAMWREAKKMRQKALAEGIDVVAAQLQQQLTTTAKGLAAKTALDGRWYISYFIRQRPRSVAAWLVIVLFQLNKLTTYYRVKALKDPLDRMKSYPSMIEEKVKKNDPDDLDDVEDAEEEDGQSSDETRESSSSSVTQQQSLISPPKDSSETSPSIRTVKTPTGEKIKRVKLPNDYQTNPVRRGGGGYVGVDLEDDARILKRAGLKKLADVVRGKGVRFNRKTLRLLRSMRHFACIGDADSAAIYRKMKRITFAKGTLVVQQHDSVSSGMYIVTRGRLVVYRKTATGSHRASSSTSSVAAAGTHPTLGSRLSSWGPGTTLGENDVLAALAAHDDDSVPKRQISIVAEQDTDVLQLDLESFRWVMDRYPGAIVSWILSTTSRQWRVATYTLGEVLGLPKSDVRDWDLEIIPLGTNIEISGSSRGGSRDGSRNSSRDSSPSRASTPTVPPSPLPSLKRRKLGSSIEMLNLISASASGMYSTTLSLSLFFIPSN